MKVARADLLDQADKAINDAREVEALQLYPQKSEYYASEHKVISIGDEQESG